MTDQEKITAPCPVFGQCGGCTYQDMAYPHELHLKQNKIEGLLNGLLDGPGSAVSPIVSSPKEYHYRNRIDLKVVRTRDERVLTGFSPAPAPKEKRQPFGLIPVEACYIADKHISDAIPEITAHIKVNLDPKYRRGNLTVRCGQQGDVFWGGIGKSLRLGEDKYFATTINGKRIYYSLDTFFQANLSILPKLFDVIRDLKVLDSDVCFLDLYGGVGLFAVGVSDGVKNIYLIEESPTSVRLAQYNKQINGILNLEILEGKVEGLIYKVLEEAAEQKKVAMIDPPRKGLSRDARIFLAGLKDIDHLLYLSCNPEALAVDLAAFKNEGWTIKAIIPFDFFPKTVHIETLCLLEPKK